MGEAGSRDKEQWVLSGASVSMCGAEDSHALAESLRITSYIPGSVVSGVPTWIVAASSGGRRPKPVGTLGLGLALAGALGGPQADFLRKLTDSLERKDIHVQACSRTP